MICDAHSARSRALDHVWLLARTERLRPELPRYANYQNSGTSASTMRVTIVVAEAARRSFSATRTGLIALAATLFLKPDEALVSLLECLVSAINWLDQIPDHCVALAPSFFCEQLYMHLIPCFLSSILTMINRSQISRLSTLSTVIALSMFLLAAGCSSSSTTDASKESSGSSLTKVKLVLNWYPEAEHGGYYAAQVHGIFAAQGLDVEIIPGGKTTIVPQELTLGRIEFGIGNADDVLMAREQAAPLVALMAPMQNGPRCIMVRADSDIKAFTDLKNITLQIDPARPYVPFMKKQGLLGENVTTVPYFGTVAQLVSDPRTAQQAYSFSEPLMAKQQGVEVRTLMMSDIGYNPYASVLIATEETVANKKELTQRMVTACIEGWKKYLESPEETNRHILSENREGMTEEALAFGVEGLRPLCLPPGFSAENLGAMSAERWETLGSQLKELGMISDKVKFDEAYSLDYLP